MTTAATALATVDSRPFFAQALRYGVDEDIITPERMQTLQNEFAKGIVQIAHYFGTAHLRPELELALQRMVRLISLSLENMSNGDLRKAAYALRDKTLLSHSKGGSEMLKTLHAMPESTLLLGQTVSDESQRAYLDEKTAAKTYSLLEYKTELAQRQANQDTIDFGFWLADKMGVARKDVEDDIALEAHALIRSAMLAMYAGKPTSAEFSLPSRTAFVGLINTIKKNGEKKSKPPLSEDRLNTLLKGAPSPFLPIARHAASSFITHDLPRIRAPENSADTLLNGDHHHTFFVIDNLDDDVREYERLVAKEWNRITREQADDPAVLASVFLCIATGMPPKASTLLKEAKEIVRLYRTSGFHSLAVLDFINTHAPETQRSDLRHFWQKELAPEVEEQIADTDPNWPDTYMERALEYLRKTCNAAWKGRNR
jgi:hypothetical protein